MYTTCTECEKDFTVQEMIDCPDNMPGCCVAHFDKPNWTCPHCEFENQAPEPDKVDYIWKSDAVQVVNTKGLDRLTIYK